MRARLPVHGASLLLVLGLAVGCERARPPPPLPSLPPPLPTATARLDVPDEPKGATAPRERKQPAAKQKQAPTPRPPRPVSRHASAPPPSRAVEGPAPVRGPSPTPPPAPRAVVVPRTPHVWAEIPPGLQRDLDADPRMQPWLERVIAIADDCHARDRGRRGTLEARVTMHASARPEADLRGVPVALAGLSLARPARCSARRCRSSPAPREPVTPCGSTSSS